MFDDKGLVLFFFKSKPRIVSRIRLIYRMSYRMRIYGRQNTVSGNPAFYRALGWYRSVYVCQYFYFGGV